MSDTPSATAELKLPKDLAAEKGMVNVQIDGVWHQFPRGTRMIEACRQSGTIVPHYCYHPKLSSPGNCRMCLVQMGMPPRPAPGQEPQRDENGYENIGWMPRPVIACANTVSENMGIRTSGELVEKCREGVMEFLLIRHSRCFCLHLSFLDINQFLQTFRPILRIARDHGESDAECTGSDPIPRSTVSELQRSCSASSAS